MKTETNSMRIVKPEKTDTAGTPQQEKTLKNRNTSPLRPLCLTPCPKMLYSSDQPMYASCSTSATRH